LEYHTITRYGAINSDSVHLKHTT